MKIANDILELKFEGNGIKPSIVKPAEIALQIEQFEKAMLSAIKYNYPAIDTDQILLSFESIQHQSLSLNFLVDQINISEEVQAATVSSFVLITTSITTEDFERLPNDTIFALKSISKFSRKYNCTASFRHNGNSLSSITPATEIKVAKLSYLKGDITIYGTIYDAGGENPNIHFKVNNDYNIIIETNKEVAKQLALRLYDYVGLKGLGKWDVKTAQIIEFKLYNIIDYKPGNIKDAFAQLSSIATGWNNYNSDLEINNRLSRF